MHPPGNRRCVQGSPGYRLARLRGERPRSRRPGRCSRSGFVSWGKSPYGRTVGVAAQNVALHLPRRIELDQGPIPAARSERVFRESAAALSPHRRATAPACQVHPHCTPRPRGRDHGPRHDEAWRYDGSRHDGAWRYDGWRHGGHEGRAVAAVDPGNIVLAADVAGYSRLMGADEDGTLAQLHAHRRALVDPRSKEATSFNPLFQKWF
jgi:hypothetical protein